MVVHRQISGVPLLCSAIVRHEDLNRLMGMNLRALRLKAKLTQEQLAERLNINRETISRWETGEKGFGKSVVLKLCSIFSVEPCRFYAKGGSAIITSSAEQIIICKIREAQQYGVDDLLMEHCSAIVDWAKRKKGTALKCVIAGNHARIAIEKGQAASKICRGNPNTRAAGRSREVNADGARREQI